MALYFKVSPITHNDILYFTANECSKFLFEIMEACYKEFTKEYINI